MTLADLIAELNTLAVSHPAACLAHVECELPERNPGPDVTIGAVRYSLGVVVIHLEEV